jgi:DNA-binding IclR family transcriptional regulator
MAKREKTEYTIQAVINALELLDQFKGDIHELGVTELSKRLGLHKNNIFRLLATLESKGYIEQNKLNENYRLGVKCLELGQNYLKQTGLLRQARPIMEELVSKCNENAYLSVLRGQKVVYIDVVEANQPVRVVSRIGAQLPPYCCASGKAQVAALVEIGEDIEKYVALPLKAITANTRTNIEDFKKDLQFVAENGYAIDDEEVDIGVRCVGAAIRDYTKRVIGAISISGPLNRMDFERIENELGPLVVESARKISEKLGYFIDV